MQRGEMWWANLREPLGAEPGFRRPVLIISSDAFNRSRIQTVLAVSLTTNTALATSPGNVLLSASETSLAKDSVANVSQLITVDKGFLSEYIATLDDATMAKVEAGLRLILSL